MELQSLPHVGETVTSGPAEDVRHFIDRVLGPVDAGGLASWKRDVADALRSGAEQERQVALHRAFESADATVERRHHGYRRTQNEVNELEDLTAAVQERVEKMTSEELKDRAIALRNAERASIAETLTRELRGNSMFKRLSNLGPSCGDIHGTFEVDRTSGRITFVREEQFLIPTFLRKMAG